MATRGCTPSGGSHDTHGAFFAAAVGARRVFGPGASLGLELALELESELVLELELEPESELVLELEPEPEQELVLESESELAPVPAFDVSRALRSEPDFSPVPEADAKPTLLTANKVASVEFKIHLRIRIADPCRSRGLADSPPDRLVTNFRTKHLVNVVVARSASKP